MDSNKTTKVSAQQANDPSEATPRQDSLTPLERLRRKLNSMPPKERKAAVERALAIWKKKRLERSSKNAANG
jgi:hypothetical protein